MDWINKLLGINWKTTLAGISVIVAAVGRIALAYRTKDFEAIFTDGQLVLSTVIGIIAGLGLIKAKDQNVTGTGSQAAIVDNAGTMTNREGAIVGHQPPPDAGKV